VNRNTIILTPAQAREAVCRDFRQYPPQLLLFSGLIRLVTQGRVKYARDNNRPGLWISTPSRRNMQWKEGRDLSDYMCTILNSAPLEPELMAAVCSRVFQTRAQAVVDENGYPAIHIPTGMETFHCTQCGQCCRILDYHAEVTKEDVARWRSQGRDDVLQWVAGVGTGSPATGYRIWVIPGTSRMAEVCPFLKQVDGQNRWQCAIHDVKPRICRQYPATRKHGLMTGCRGFAV